MTGAHKLLKDISHVNYRRDSEKKRKKKKRSLAFMRTPVKNLQDLSRPARSKSAFAVAPESSP